MLTKVSQSPLLCHQVFANEVTAKVKVDPGIKLQLKVEVLLSQSVNFTKRGKFKSCLQNDIPNKGIFFLVQNVAVKK